MNVQDLDWVEKMLALSLQHEVEAPSNEPRPNTLWVSLKTGRRGTVMWVMNGQVSLEWRPGVRSEHQLVDFLRLYKQV